jgi:hypothetical protein
VEVEEMERGEVVGVGVQEMVEERVKAMVGEAAGKAGPCCHEGR